MSTSSGHEQDSAQRSMEIYAIKAGLAFCHFSAAICEKYPAK
jgi:hypothetical protein